MEFQATNTNPASGLTTAAAKQRLESAGPNTLQQTKRVQPFKILLSQFKDILTIILLICTVLSFVMGDMTEAIAIIAIVILNALFGFFQEYRTEKTIDALKNMAAPTSRVLRDGKERTIPSSEIVPGDIILIEEGDRVPSDSSILECYDLHVDESLLTGESIAVEKSASTGKAAELFMGTIVTSGRGKAVTTATGMDTEMGKIAGMLDEIEELETPLQKRLNQLGKYIGIGCLAVCAVVSIAGILRGEAVYDMILMGISLAVAAVPEGLAAIVTIALALAVNRMVKRKALIRRLHAVETLGCSSVICSDKTGTLTENKMTVKKICTLDKAVSVTGDGYEKEGAFLQYGKEIRAAQDKDLALTLTAACLCNNASIQEKNGRSRSLRKGKSVYSATGDPTEIALLIAGAKAGLERVRLEQQYRKADEIPFSSDRKCMSVLAAKGGTRYLFTKGAPDILLEKCTQVHTSSGIRPMSASIKSSLLAQNDAMGAEALRVLGVAYRENPTGSKKDMEQGLVFLGLIGMIDPPRKASYQAVKVCRQAGIRPVMITGDHKVTARAIAAELEIYREGDQILTGRELDQMSEADLLQVVQKTTVFARVSPRHKLQIVRAFKQCGHVVAMTGDGVNDAPAMKESDIGVAMGISGTDVAKEAAGVILLDDNFATLIAAVEEGRVIYKNIRKFIRYLLSCNVGEVMTMFIGILAGLPVILLPIQILWINLVTDGLPAIALGLDPADTDVMQEPPRGANEGIFSGGLMRKIIVRGMMIAACTLGVFLLLQNQSGSLEVARTGAFFTLVITQLIHVFECKSETKSLFQIKLFNNIWLVLATGVSLAMILSVIYIPALQPIFKTVSLSFTQITTAVLVSVCGPVLAALFTRSPKQEEISPPAEMPQLPDKSFSAASYRPARKLPHPRVQIISFRDK